MMLDTFILFESVALFLVYTLIFIATYKARGIDKYFLVFIASLALSASWLFLTEISLFADLFAQIADRNIRPTVNRGIQLLGGLYFLYGCTRVNRKKITKKKNA